MTLVQTELKKIYLGGNVADMQGPCPTGFHVPTQTERGNIISLLSTLGITTGNNMKLYLKLPFAGIVYGGTSWDKQYLNVYGNYYASSPAYESGGLNRVKGLQIDASNINNDYSPTRNTALPIRPFKDIPSIPDETWTALYSDKIYHNSTLGLISISDDGTNRITIADKNLGATQVYNDGDTLSEANCGKYYQWGNNYGFPFTGAVTTSGTQVNAQNYGPGNYYSSSTFIYNNTNYDWSIVSNPNLRGGVSGSTKEIKRVTIRPNGTEKQIRPVGGWTPGANTIAYYSFDDQSNSQITDASGNGYNLIGTAPSYQQLSGTDYYGVFNGSQGGWCNMNISGDFTQIMWINISDTGQQYMSMVDSNDGTSAQISIIYGYRSGEIEMYTPGNRATLQSSTQLNTWYLVSITKESGTLKGYINGVYKTQFSTSVTGTKFYLGKSNLGDYFKGSINNCILENRARTAQEISDYYNQTKGNYGL